MSAASENPTVIVSIGTDLIEVERIREIRARRCGRFDARVYTPAELSYSLGRAHPEASLAARFAVKEAVMKVLGTGWAEGIRWRDIEVVVDARGAPAVQLHGVARERARALGIAHLHVSISHSRAHAVAVAVAEGEPPLSAP
jgi:holo-[acyl-carrier protein] synthase